ncbi:signal transduction histidine kinase regulating citrate/malate metabolism [Desulfofarcimen acetoxidans DSM 771]|uniref:Signal transduction histidine kinase regulating citrate/malate metabolism n=1 Tax=Desulfofarcimen acetoxidans (strain ATCC 49208 / DSM 771 / KCTC 5769 / VKM B-1644 / 5575) TaxID=485916 RepID=C8W4X8_DESAS|nr:GHKL domain-containing protein [Desulfofarcimen acetoxidans]ACV61330.1 signal transduction histidine kinase regulating citrate/malate metabolism [Desulfofarcimen acetoxidans DSM 771]
MQMTAKKTMEQLAVLLLIETCLALLAARVINFYENQMTASDVLISIMAVLNFGICLFIAKWIYKVEIIHEKVSTQNECLKSTEEALKIMRSERHDFINHLQTIYGLIVTGEHNEAVGYIKDIGVDCKFNSQILNIQNPYIRILLQNKKNLTSAKNITFKLKVESNLMYLNIIPTAVTTVFGNLLDNAIDAVMECGTEYRKIISFEISETNTGYHFLIQNTGPPINEEIEQDIFKEGFSTKGTGRGYGLVLVKKTVNEYDGRVFYDREAKGFSVILPKRED